MINSPVIARMRTSVPANWQTASTAILQPITLVQSDGAPDKLLSSLVEVSPLGLLIT